MLLGKKSLILSESLIIFVLSFKLSHISKDRAFVGWATEPSMWANLLSQCQTALFILSSAHFETVVSWSSWAFPQTLCSVMHPDSAYSTWITRSGCGEDLEDAVWWRGSSALKAIPISRLNSATSGNSSSPQSLGPNSILHDANAPLPPWFCLQNRGVERMEWPGSSSMNTCVILLSVLFMPEGQMGWRPTAVCGPDWWPEWGGRDDRLLWLWIIILSNTTEAVC